MAKSPITLTGYAQKASTGTGGGHKQAARHGDPHTCPIHGGGAIAVVTTQKTFCNNKLIAREGDIKLCPAGGPNRLAEGTRGVYVEGSLWAQQTSQGVHSSQVASGSPDTYLNPGQGSGSLAGGVQKTDVQSGAAALGAYLVAQTARMGAAGPEFARGAAADMHFDLRADRFGAGSGLPPLQARTPIPDTSTPDLLQGTVNRFAAALQTAQTLAPLVPLAAKAGQILLTGHVDYTREPMTEEERGRLLQAKKDRYRKRQALIEAIQEMHRLNNSPLPPDIEAQLADFSDHILLAEAARAADYIYHDDWTPNADVTPPVGLRRLPLGDMPPGLRNKALWEDEELIYRARIYVSDVTGKMYVVVRGTQGDKVDWRNFLPFDLLGQTREDLFGAPKDRGWIMNWTQGSDLGARDYTRAAALYRRLRQAFPDTDMTIVGHSKSGGMAELGSAITGLRGIAFNGAGLSPETLARFNAPHDPGTLTWSVRNHGDPLTTLQDPNMAQAVVADMADSVKQYHSFRNTTEPNAKLNPLYHAANALPLSAYMFTKYQALYPNQPAIAAGAWALGKEAETFPDYADEQIMKQVKFRKSKMQQGAGRVIRVRVPLFNNGTKGEIGSDNLDPSTPEGQAWMDYIDGRPGATDLIETDAQGNVLWDPGQPDDPAHAGLGWLAKAWALSGGPVPGTPATKRAIQQATGSKPIGFYHGVKPTIGGIEARKRALEPTLEAYLDQFAGGREMRKTMEHRRLEGGGHG